MNKKISRVFGKKIFLLGKNEFGENCWLEEASWDCDWYWGFGYIETYTNNNNPSLSKDIESRQRFDGLFLEDDIFYSFKKYFKETPLNDDEIWQLLGYMKEFYLMSKYAELLQYGNYITFEAKSILEEKNQEENLKERKRINEILLPELFQKIYKLLGEV